MGIAGREQRNCVVCPNCARIDRGDPVPIMRGGSFRRALIESTFAAPSLFFFYRSPLSLIPLFYTPNRHLPNRSFSSARRLSGPSLNTSLGFFCVPSRRATFTLHFAFSRPRPKYLIRLVFSTLPSRKLRAARFRSSSSKASALLQTVSETLFSPSLRSRMQQQRRNKRKQQTKKGAREKERGKNKKRRNKDGNAKGNEPS